jgi:hypothetical protein
VRLDAQHGRHGALAPAITDEKEVFVQKHFKLKMSGLNSGLLKHYEMIRINGECYKTLRK